MSAGRVVIRHERLKAFAQALIERTGMPADGAALIADSLIYTNLRGVDSHGVQLLHFYLQRFEGGEIDVRATGRVVSENGACLVYDGENGAGQVVSAECCKHAVRVAKEHGVGVVLARESGHFGAAAYWAERISANGMIGIVMCTASPSIAPWQSKEPKFGTNPICVSVPGGRWLLDMATTTVAFGKVFKAWMSGEPEIPAGWAVDAAGVPTTSTEAAMKGWPMPLGGYKGYGLAMFVEILCGVLAGGGFGTDLGGIRFSNQRLRVGQTFIAIDVSRFIPVPEFESRMERLIEMMKTATPADGFDEVLVAGEPEWRMQELRRREGIPVPAGVWEKLLEAAERLGVQVPAVEAS